MPKYLFGYHGGSGMAATPEETDKVMKAWGDWFGELGGAVVDGGNPTMPSKTVDGRSVSDTTSNPLSGYSIIEAGNMDDAVRMAKGCPVLANGGSVEVAELIPM